MARTSALRDPSLRLWAAGLAAIYLTTLSPHAAAEPKPLFLDAPSIKVSFADLDLSKPAGADTLYKRIKRASRMVCRDSASPSDPKGTRSYRKCYEAAMDNAVRHVGVPTLTALHQGDTAKRTAGLR
jgi:UrcA family protein